MRKFFLENKYGEKFHFNYFNKAILTDTSGLGFINTFSYLKYENYYETISDSFEMSEINGIITFLNGYKGYSDFLKYLTNGKEDLKLYYESHDLFYAHVDIVSLSKSEIKVGGLQSEIIFRKKSYWIKKRSFEITTNPTGSGKIYPYTYGYSYADSSFGFIDINIGGHLRAEVLVEINGSVNNPTLKVSRGAITVSELRLIITKEDVQIKVSSLLNEKYISEIVNGEYLDIYHLQDFSKDNFLKLDTGNLTFEFIPGTSGISSCKLYIQEYYLG